MTMTQPTRPVKAFGRWLWRFLDTHFLPVSLVAFVILGAVLPEPGQFLSGDAVSDVPPPPKDLVSNVLVALIFLISGLSLKTSEIKEGLTSWMGCLFGVISILVLTPTLAFALIYVPLHPPELSLGIALFALMPMTLSSGVVITKQAGGNTPLALLLTVSTNFVAIFSLPFTVPLLISLYTAGSAASDVSVHIDGVQLLVQLLYSILAPLVAGKLLTHVPGVNRCMLRWSKTSKHVSSLFLTLMVYLNVSKSVGKLRATDPLWLIATAGMGAALQVVYLAFNAAMCWLLGLPTPIKKAVVVCASSKTLPVTVTVVQALPKAVGEGGLMLVGAILCHFCQVIIASMVASWWAHHTTRTHNTHTSKHTCETHVLMYFELNTYIHTHSHTRATCCDTRVFPMHTSAP
eukprot:GDKI01023939.1.p1 GENE.GDKI01023939.1~~GDKI01023939.1.p1  ORF type:complete len:415 (+),score=91.86 GDKI01023939.1:34-1245(+)